MARRLFVRLLAGFAVTFAPGCGGPTASSTSTGDAKPQPSAGSSAGKAKGAEKEKFKSDPRMDNALAIVGGAWTDFHRKKGVAPSSLADLEPVIREGMKALINSPDLLAMVNSGEIVVVYGVGKISQDARGFIAYAKDTPTEGGAVVTRGGLVSKAPPEIFKRIGAVKSGD